MNEIPQSPELPLDESSLNPLLLGLASMLALRAIAKAKAAADKCVLGAALAGPAIILMSEFVSRQQP